MRKFMEKIWPLAPKSKRHHIFFPGVLPRDINVHNDGEYLCQVAAITTLVVEIILLALLLGDIQLGADALISKEMLNDNPLLFIKIFMSIMGPISLIIGALFYTRIRISTNMELDAVPIFINKTLMRKQTRSDRIWALIILLTLCFSVMIFPRFTTTALLERYGYEDDFLLVILWQSFLIAILAALVPLTISCALLLEKTLRFFSSIHLDQ